jgi:hypothetical protein
MSEVKRLDSLVEKYFIGDCLAFDDFFKGLNRLYNINPDYTQHVYNGLHLYCRLLDRHGREWLKEQIKHKYEPLIHEFLYNK